MLKGEKVPKFSFTRGRTYVNCIANGLRKTDKSDNCDSTGKIRTSMAYSIHACVELAMKECRYCKISIQNSYHEIKTKKIIVYGLQKLVTLVDSYH